MQLDDLVILAKVSHPIPFRTRTLNPLALMVLRLKARESKSLPDLPNTPTPLFMFVMKTFITLVMKVFFRRKTITPMVLRHLAALQNNVHA